MRARDLGIRFDGTPGPLNGITDVAGVEVGMVTLVESGSADGSGSVAPVCSRTGVTAILPLGRDGITTSVPSAISSLNSGA